MGPSSRSVAWSLMRPIGPRRPGPASGVSTRPVGLLPKRRDAREQGGQMAGAQKVREGNLPRNARRRAFIEAIDVLGAERRLRGKLVQTPFLRSRVLSSITGARVF